MLASRRHSSVSNSKTQVEVRCNKIFSKTEPGLADSTKPDTSIAKWSYSKSPLETPHRNLEAISVLYFKYRQTYLNTSVTNRIHKTKKKENNRKKRNTWNTDF